MKITIFPFTTAMCGICGGHMQAAPNVRLGVTDPHILMECITEGCPQEKQRVKVRGQKIDQDPKRKGKEAK